MKLTPSQSRLVSALAACCYASITAPSYADTSITTNEKSQSTARSSATTPASKDETNQSPRERGRILVKLNPIASEYQVFGDLGTSPGADSDGEGVDYRAFFPSGHPSASTTDQLSVDLNLNYNHASGIAKPGLGIQFTKLLGDSSKWVLSGQFRHSASERRIEHYESVWQETELESGDSAFILDRPRFSYDEFYTRNNTYALQLGYHVSENHKLYFKTYYQDYFDNAYRNRLELQLAGGDLDESTAVIDGENIVSGSVTGAKTRRYFGDTDNTRTRQHNSFGGTYEGSEWTIDYSVYSQKWDLDTVWYNWNFNDFDLDFTYDASNPYTPDLSYDNGSDITDTSNTRFSSVRVHNTYTRDRDIAARVDADRSLSIGNQTVWIQTGYLYRTKERKSWEDRSVYSVDTANPFYLDQISYDSPQSILAGTYDIQTGLDPDAGRALMSSNPEYFVYSEFNSIIESAPNSYDAEETVSSLYGLATSKFGPWQMEAGVRFEYTETATRGTVVLPESVNDPDEGTFLQSISDPNSGTDYIIKELYSSNDYTNLLPTIEASYQVNEKNTLKASWFKLLMRPQYSNIVDYRRVSTPTQTISEGNPELEPTLIDKFRLAWNHELKNSGTLSAELYYIKIENFFYGAVAEEYILEDGAPVLYRVSRVENGDSGNIKGFEVQWRQRLPNLGAIQNSVFDFAYTYSDSESHVSTRPNDTLRVPERSDHLAKASLSSQIGKLRPNLSVSYQSDALDDVGESFDQDVTREDVITAQVGARYLLNERITLSASVSNLINHPERSYEGSDVRISRNQYSEWYGSLGAKYVF